MARDGLLTAIFRPNSSAFSHAAYHHDLDWNHRRRSGHGHRHRVALRSDKHRDALRFRPGLPWRHRASPHRSESPPSISGAVVRSFPILGVLFCVALMLSLPIETWIRFFVWLIIGLAIYFLYSVRHSRLRHGVDEGRTEESSRRSSSPKGRAGWIGRSAARCYYSGLAWHSVIERRSARSTCCHRATERSIHRYS